MSDEQQPTTVPERQNTEPDVVIVRQERLENEDFAPRAEVEAPSAPEPPARDERPTTTEISESLNGFDEIAIMEKFHGSLDELKGAMTVRALIFVLLRRGGANDKAAFDEAMYMTQRALMDSPLLIVETEDDAADPDGESGKGAPRPVSGPTS